MGKLRALRLGILKGSSHKYEEDIGHPPLCPREHDIESLTRLISKNKSWRMAKKVAVMGSKMIGQEAPDGLDDLVLANALKEHDKECVTGPESKWCHCHWCDRRRELLKNGND